MLLNENKIMFNLEDNNQDIEEIISNTFQAEDGVLETELDLEKIESEMVSDSTSFDILRFNAIAVYNELYRLMRIEHAGEFDMPEEEYELRAQRIFDGIYSEKDRAAFEFNTSMA